MLTARVQRWSEGGELVEVAGRRLFVRRRAGHGPLLVFLHGFPSSSYDWRELLAHFEDRRSLAMDLLGYGLSEKPSDHVYTLGEQAMLVSELVAREASAPVFLVAHDMGTSVATELMARDLRGELDFELSGALLFNGSILLERATPTVGQRLLRGPLGPVFARLTTERTFRAQFARVFSARHPLSTEEAADQWSLIAHHGGHRIAHLLINYMNERDRLTDRWHGAFRDWPGPLSLAWGLLDPVATTNVLDGLRELRPGVAVHELPDLAHYPQIEQPAAIAAALEQALSRSR
ncbi:MAG TPA: alpha/beta hydrolase [Solirubrobacteraceae bacterium]|nr:alpha/beta hydrolase [Solirubrobacteraceae bacterium]